MLFASQIPQMPRRFPGQRGIRILVRTAHIGAVVLFMGAVLGGSRSVVGAAALGGTGIYLVIDQMIRDGSAHFRYVAFWAVILKILALTLGILNPDWLVAALWFCLVVGGLISHAPGRVRHHALWGEKGPCAKHPAHFDGADASEGAGRFGTNIPSEMCQSTPSASSKAVSGLPGAA